MKISFTQLAQAEFDICIIGSGPAGMIVALELERLAPQRRILLLEYGYPGIGPVNALDESIEVSDLVHHHRPDECTIKGLGGTSATWGGRCVMYDEADFIPREPFKQHCTWPAAIRSEVAAHRDIAADYFECTAGGFSLHELKGLVPEYQPIAEKFREGAVLDSKVEKWSRPTRFGARYSARLDQSMSIAVATGCELRQLHCRGDRIESVAVRSVQTGQEYKVTAGTFVLAMGAQESTRLLLKSPEVFASRGGPPAALGKYYQGHISGKIASVQFFGDPRKTDYGFIRSNRGEYLRRRFEFSTDTLVERNLLNTALWLDNPLYFDPAHRSGPMSFMYLAMVTPGLGKRLAPPSIAHSITKGKVNAIGAHLANIVRGLPGSLTIPASIFFCRYCLSRKLPGVFLPSRSNRYALHFHAEQVPTEQNRMELGPDGDSLVIHYGYTDYDVDSVLRSHRILDEWLQTCGCGRLEYWEDESKRAESVRQNSKDGVHQVGTTRMSVRAEDGVVDGDLKVWGVENLFICSSSVFPTSGQANPTFLLGAFAVRLAHHLTKHAHR